MINGLPSIYEVVSGKKEAQEVSSVTNNGNSKSKVTAFLAVSTLLLKCGLLYWQ